MASTVASRSQEKIKFTGWSNIAEIRALQEKSWAVYVSTGAWNSPQQIEWNKQANEIRKKYNPSAIVDKMGTKNKEEANAEFTAGSFFVSATPYTEQVGGSFGVSEAISNVTETVSNVTPTVTATNTQVNPSSIRNFLFLGATLLIVLKVIGKK